MFQIEIHDKNGNPKQRFPHIRSFIIGRYHCEGTEWLVELKLTHSSGEEFPVMLSDYDRFAIVTQLENEAVAEIIRLRDAGVDDEEIEIINCFSGDVRYTPEEFIDDFESIEPDVED